MPFKEGRTMSHSVLSHSLIGFNFITESIMSKYTKMLINQSGGDILMESIALNTAACQKCIESASSFSISGLALF